MGFILRTFDQKKKKAWTTWDRISSGEWKEQILVILCHGIESSVQFQKTEQHP